MSGPRRRIAIVRDRPPSRGPLITFVILWGVNALSLWVAWNLFPGSVSFETPTSLALAGLLLALANALVKPVLLILTLPISVLTLGLFILVVNGLVLMLVAALVPGFAVSGFWAGVGVALFISIFSFVVNRLVGR